MASFVNSKQLGGVWCHMQGSKQLRKFRPSRPECPLTADP